MNRLEMIKQSVNKIQGNDLFRETMKKSNMQFVKDCNRKIAKIKAKEDRKLAKEMDALNENYNDVDAKTARKIADDTVGETYRETTRFDNEWN